MFPMGIMDIPEESKQVVYAVDALRSNIIVVGAKQRGKTTTLMTLMCSAATMYSPSRVTFFCVGGATLAQIGSLPHVTDIVSPKDNEGIERILSSMDALINAREDAFRRAKIDLDGFRERRFGPGSDGLGGTDPNDPFGDVFVVLDDYDDLYAKDNLLGDRIISLSSRGPEYGVHVMCSAGGWIHGQRQSLLQNVTARIQLRLADPSESQMGHSSIESREAARRTLNRPGFGLTDSLHELRVGVPALVDPATGELVNITDVGASIAQVAGVTKHANLQRLPQRVELKAILEYEAAHPSGDDLSIAFAIGERHQLGPVPMRLRESPGMMILGRQGCGKTMSLVAIGEAVMSRFSPAGGPANADRPQNRSARAAGSARAGLRPCVCLRPGRDRRGDHPAGSADLAAPVTSQGFEPGGVARAQAVGRAPAFRAHRRCPGPAPGTELSAQTTRGCVPVEADGACPADRFARVHDAQQCELRDAADGSVDAVSELGEGGSAVYGQRSAKQNQSGGARTTVAARTWPVGGRRRRCRRNFGGAAVDGHQQ